MHGHTYIKSLHISDSKSKVKGNLENLSVDVSVV